MAIAVTSFQTPVTLSPVRRASGLQTQKLSDIDEMCIENVAELCLQADLALQADCDLEEHEALVNQLEAQKVLLEAHVKKVDNLLHRLKGEAVNGLQEEETYFAG